MIQLLWTQNEKKSIAVILHLGMVQQYRTRIRKGKRFCFFLLQIPKVRAKTCVEKIVLCSCKKYVRSVEQKGCCYFGLQHLNRNS